jgi:hypothetical protein
LSDILTIWHINCLRERRIDVFDWNAGGTMNMFCTAFGRLLIATPIIAYSLGAIAQQVPNVGSDTGTNASSLIRPPAEF